MAEMFAVSSSNIAAIGYDENSQTLTVQFHSGGTYEYDGVPPNIFGEFQNAGSPGSYFHANIKGRYESSKV